MRLIVLVSLFLGIISNNYAQGCAVCFNNVENDSNIIALKWSMFCLLFILIGVLLLFTKFFLRIRKYDKITTQ